LDAGSGAIDCKARDILLAWAIEWVGWAHNIRSRGAGVQEPQGVAVGCQSTTMLIVMVPTVGAAVFETAFMSWGLMWLVSWQGGREEVLFRSR
jgi:hypothetical protein